jgi:hypothetical protein
LASYTSGAYTWVGSNWYNSSGNKYIGTGFATLYEQNDGKHAWFTAASGTAGNAITFTQAMTLDASGNLSAGTTSLASSGQTNGITSGSVLAVKGPLTAHTTSAGIFEYATATNKVSIRAYGATSGTGIIAFNTGGGGNSADAEVARISSTGSLLVNKTSGDTTTPGVEIYNNSAQAGRINITKNTSGLFNALANYSSGTSVGGINYDNTSTSFPTSSDVRMKKDIVDAASASAKIDQIRIVSHGWKHDDAVVEFGVIAQELVNVAPQAVAVGDDGEEVETTWGVDYSKLIPLLIKAHQEQQALIETLTQRITALEGA